MRDCSCLVVKVLDCDGLVTRSSPVPLKTSRVGEQCTINRRRAQTSSHSCVVAGLHRNVGASRFNGPYGRQGCVLARTVEFNQGGRIESNESVADSFRSGAVSFKKHVHAIFGAFFLFRLPEKPPI
ncbi:hypothetical protein TNCV_1046951 [Trichonephila clavipes]|nr:hypothetical protein TNCV_1046951 [Trichonephila clavipes]